MKLSEFLKEWDRGRFEFTDHLPGSGRPAVRPEGPDGSDGWKERAPKDFSVIDYRAYRSLAAVFSAILAVTMIGFMLYVVICMPPFNSADTPANTSEVIERYISKGLEETGAVNIVAGVILDYRAFDTLGESFVLFTATIAVMSLLLLPSEEEEPFTELRILYLDLVLKNTSKILFPFITLFGISVILNGHLGPGGGFSGGAIIGGALILFTSANGPARLQRILSFNTYRYIVLCALSFYACSKCYSFFCGANGLHTIFGPGTPGAIFSAGLILPLNVAVGTVVACTMYGFYSLFTRGRI